MVNFHDPAVVRQDQLALIKLSLTVEGLYIWEFVTTLDYEWRVIQGRQPYRWTIWIYSLARLAMLMTVIMNMIQIRVICQVWTTINFIFAYVTFSSSSLLMILRIVAIWNRNKIVVGLVAVIWSVNASFLIFGIVQIHSTWVPAKDSCTARNIESNKATIISMFINDSFLLVVMLVGLLRMRVRGVGTFALGRLLWEQGVIWLIVATSAELPPVIFMFLNLNNSFDAMFMMPSLITMTIAATWMYRSLADFCSNDVLMDPDIPPKISRTVSNSKPTFVVPTPPRWMEFTTHTTHGTYPTSLADENVLYIGDDRPTQLHDEQDDLRFDDDVESGI